MVGVPGLEPGASASQTQRSAKLSYTPLSLSYGHSGLWVNDTVVYYTEYTLENLRGG